MPLSRMVWLFSTGLHSDTSLVLEAGIAESHQEPGPGQQGEMFCLVQLCAAPPASLFTQGAGISS